MGSNLNTTMIGPSLRSGAFLPQGLPITVCNPTKGLPPAQPLFGQAQADFPEPAAAPSQPRAAQAPGVTTGTGQSAGPPAAAWAGYELTIATDNAISSGTDEAIVIEITGDKGSSGVCVWVIYLWH